MPKPERTDWRCDPSTDAQHLKLLLMLRDRGVIEPEPRADIFDYQDAAVDWVNLEFQFNISALADLTKGEIQRCFEELE